MSFNGSGVFQRLYSWVNDAAANIKIRADRMDAEMNGMATGLSTCITKDGQTTITANLPMAGFNHTGVGNATSRNHYASFGQLQDGKANWVAAGGTADAITAAYSIPVTALVDGQLFFVRASAANATTAPTFNPNSLGAQIITKNGAAVLVAGDIPGAGYEMVLRYRLSDTKYELLNPATGLIADGSVTTAKIANSAVTTANIVDGAVTHDKIAALVRKMMASEQGFRLTLTTGVPVTTADVTGATTIYCTPYKGNSISLYDGTNWNIRTSSEFSLALGTLTSGRPYDVFCYDNAGVPTLEFTAWTNDTTRATALVYQDGVLVKTGATTRRYLGTFYTTSTTATSDAVAGRYLWNYYHRVYRNMIATDATNNWNYTTATIRQANANTANQLNFVVGVSEDIVTATVSGAASNSSTGVEIEVLIGLDSTSAAATGFINRAANVQVSNLIQNMSADWSGIPGIGRHYLAWLEYSAASGTTTWLGDNGTSSRLQSGISGSVMG